MFLHHTTQTRENEKKKKRKKASVSVHLLYVYMFSFSCMQVPRFKFAAVTHAESIVIKMTTTEPCSVDTEIIIEITIKITLL